MVFIINRACYIEFAIQNTPVFIIATKILDINHLPDEMTIVAGNNPNLKGTKLIWSKLNKADGTSLRAAPMVVSQFKKLESDGWTVDKEAFMDYHFPKSK